MGHENRRYIGLALDLADLVAQFDPELDVEMLSVIERKKRAAYSERAGKRDALLLPTARLA